MDRRMMNWLFALLLVLLLIPESSSAQNPQSSAFRNGSDRFVPQQDVQNLPQRFGKITPPNRTDSQSASDPSEMVTRTGSAWSTFGWLSLVVLLILIAARFLKKHGPLVNGGIPHEAIEILGRKYLDQKQSIFLLRLGSRVLVIGSSANGLRTLTEVTDPVEIDYLAGLCRPSHGDNSVAQTFRSLFGRQSFDEASSQENGPATVAATFNSELSGTLGAHSDTAGNANGQAGVDVSENNSWPFDGQTAWSEVDGQLGSQSVMRAAGSLDEAHG